MRKSFIIATGVFLLLAAWTAASRPPERPTASTDQTQTATADPAPSPEAKPIETKPVEAKPVEVSNPNPEQTPEPSPEPPSEAEQFKALVLQKTDGILAYEAISNIPAERLFAQQKKVATTVKDVSSQGISIRQVKESVADQLQIQQGYDEKLAYNVASGIIDGSLAWQRGEKPQQ